MKDKTKNVISILVIVICLCSLVGSSLVEKYHYKRYIASITQTVHSECVNKGYNFCPYCGKRLER